MPPWLPGGPPGPPIGIIPGWLPGPGGQGLPAPGPIIPPTLPSGAFSGKSNCCILRIVASCSSRCCRCCGVRFSSGILTPGQQISNELLIETEVFCKGKRTLRHVHISRLHRLVHHGSASVAHTHRTTGWKARHDGTRRPHRAVHPAGSFVGAHWATGVHRAGR